MDSLATLAPEDSCCVAGCPQRGLWAPRKLPTELSALLPGGPRHGSVCHDHAHPVCAAGCGRDLRGNKGRVVKSEAWASGCELDWAALHRYTAYQGEEPRRICDACRRAPSDRAKVEASRREREAAASYICPVDDCRSRALNRCVLCYMDAISHCSLP